MWPPRILQNEKDKRFFQVEITMYKYRQNNKQAKF